MDQDVASVAATLRRALEAVDEAGIPADLREAALPSAIQLTAGAAGLSLNRRDVERPAEPLEPVASDEVPLGRFAQRLGIPMEVLEDVYVVVDEQLHLGVPSRNIASSKKEGAGEIAVLVSAGRQGTGVDQDLTPVSEVRRWVKELNRYDEKHFGEHIRGADHLLTIVGRGQTRQLRVKWHEADQLRALILKAAGRE